MKPLCDPKGDPKRVDSRCDEFICELWFGDLIVIDSCLERWMRSQLNLTIHIFYGSFPYSNRFLCEIIRYVSLRNNPSGTVSGWDGDPGPAGHLIFQAPRGRLRQGVNSRYYNVLHEFT